MIKSIMIKNLSAASYFEKMNTIVFFFRKRRDIIIIKSYFFIFFFNMNERKAIMLDTSEYETLTWLIHMVKDWIDFGYLAKSVSSVLQLLLLLSVLFLLIYFVYSIIFLIIYICTFYLYIWKKTYTKEEDISWNKPRQRLAQCMNLYGKIWHGESFLK